ncbi:MAG: DNA-3-methyladenine glycosylase family protein [Thermaurantiacus sp.]
METGEADERAAAHALLAAEAEALGRAEPRFADIVAAHGLPEPRVSPRGPAGLLRAIVGQQVSIHAARAIWERVERAVGDPSDPAALLAADGAALRAAGLSRQKVAYVESLAATLVSGALPIDALPGDDEAAIARIVQVKGLGRWTAEIYLLFAEGRRDVLPAGDLALQVAAGRVFGLAERPAERALRAMGAAWAPWRGAAAHLLWHAYRLEPV